MAQVYKLSRLLDNNVTKSKWYRWCWINYSLRCSFFWFFVIRSPPFFPLSTILVIRAHSLRSWRRLNVFISIARDLFYLSFLMSFMSELSFLLPSALPSSPLFPSLLLPSSSSLIPPLLAYFYACFPASAYFSSVACLLFCSHSRLLCFPSGSLPFSVLIWHLIRAQELARITFPPLSVIVIRWDAVWFIMAGFIITLCKLCWQWCRFLLFLYVFWIDFELYQNIQNWWYILI